MDTAMGGGAPDIRAEFARRRRGRSLATLGLVIVLGVMLLIENLDIHGRLVLAIFGVDMVAMLGLFVYIFRVWRCPACNKYLGAQTSFGVGTPLTACPKCNAEFV